MHKLLASIKKESILLVRDPGGLAILFIMPLLLLLVITAIQQSTFNSLQQIKIPILWVDDDQGTVSGDIRSYLASTGTFTLVPSTEDVARSLVAKGEYQLGIVIPKGLSDGLRARVAQNVQGILSRLGLVDEDVQGQALQDPMEVRIYFDPALGPTLKNDIQASVDKMVSQIETQSIYAAFQQQLPDEMGDFRLQSGSLLKFTGIVPTQNGQTATIPNASQHNVPAWTLFAIFFIILPLSSNLVREKRQGTVVRLRAQPVAYGTVLGGKTIVYLLVCLVQFTLMLFVGVSIFPLIGLPGLEIANGLPQLFLVACSSGLAAIGLGILIGTVVETQEQAAPFGATLVVILAALGGVWVPVFVMPPFMQALSKISPMNWGLNAFYDVFLRGAGLLEIASDVLPLLAFFALALIAAITYDTIKRSV